MGLLNFYASMLHTNMLRMMKALRKTGLSFDEHILNSFYTFSSISTINVISWSEVTALFGLTFLLHYKIQQIQNGYSHIYDSTCIVMTSLEINTVNSDLVSLIPLYGIMITWPFYKTSAACSNLKWFCNYGWIIYSKGWTFRIQGTYWAFPRQITNANNGLLWSRGVSFCSEHYRSIFFTVILFLQSSRGPMTITLTLIRTKRSVSTFFFKIISAKSLYQASVYCLPSFL